MTGMTIADYTRLGIRKIPTWPRRDALIERRQVIDYTRARRLA
jgi:hypothetical protein